MVAQRYFYLHLRIGNFYFIGMAGDKSGEVSPQGQEVHWWGCESSFSDDSYKFCGLLSPLQPLPVVTAKPSISETPILIMWTFSFTYFFIMKFKEGKLNKIKISGRRLPTPCGLTPLTQAAKQVGHGFSGVRP